MISEHDPDIVILDVDMPGKDGFEAASAIIRKNTAVGVIFLTMHNTESLFNAALDLGVKGYVLKTARCPKLPIVFGLWPPVKITSARRFLPILSIAPDAPMR